MRLTRIPVSQWRTHKVHTGRQHNIWEITNMDLQVCDSLQKLFQHTFCVDLKHLGAILYRFTFSRQIICEQSLT